MKETGSVIGLSVQFQLNCETSIYIDYISLKLLMTPPAHRLVKQTFNGKMTTYEKLQLINNSKSLIKNKFCYNPFSFNLTVEHIQL